MIRQVREKDIDACVQVIQESFGTVADALGFTPQNAPRFTAFATTADRLKWHMYGEHRPMYAWCEDEKIIGYYSLLVLEHKECELNNLCVLPSCRHKGIGKRLIHHCFDIARTLGCEKLKIGIVEENKILRKWYESLGFLHTGTKKSAAFPFTIGSMEKNLK